MLVKSLHRNTRHEERRLKGSNLLNRCIARPYSGKAPITADSESQIHTIDQSDSEVGDTKQILSSLRGKS